MLEMNSGFTNSMGGVITFLIIALFLSRRKELIYLPAVIFEPKVVYGISQRPQVNSLQALGLFDKMFSVTYEPTFWDTSTPRNSVETSRRNNGNLALGFFLGTIFTFIVLGTIALIILLLIPATSMVTGIGLVCIFLLLLFVRRKAR